MSHVLNGVSSLPHLGVLRVEGADAISFLQGQLTQDFALLPAHRGTAGRVLHGEGPHAGELHRIQTQSIRGRCW